MSKKYWHDMMIFKLVWEVVTADGCWGGFAGVCTEGCLSPLWASSRAERVVSDNKPQGLCTEKLKSPTWALSSPLGPAQLSLIH